MVDALTPERLWKLLRALLRAGALEAALAEADAAAIAPRRLSPAVPAALSLRRRSDGTGDLFSLRRGAPAAALLFGPSMLDLARQAVGSSLASAQGRDAGGFPTDLPRGLLAPVESPGTLVEVLAGCALAFRLRGEDRVALLVDDADGSASGYWHEGLNLAAVQNAPLVLVVDSQTRGARTAAVARLASRGPAYGVQTVTVEGGDPAEVLATVTEAVRRARAGAGTHLVEVGPGEGQGLDPVEAVATRLDGVGALDDEALRDWRTEAFAEAREAVARAMADPPAREAYALGGVSA